MNEPVNPYQPPSTDVGTAAYVDSLEPAGRGRRFLTYLIDYVCFLVLVTVVAVIIGLALGEAGVEMLQGPMQYVVSFAVFFGYYLVFEGLLARTPGKFVCGTVVVDEAGGKPSLGQVAGRTAARLIPFEPFSMFTSQRIAWHDSLPRTRVVLAAGRS